jgi:hypothetical protein
VTQRNPAPSLSSPRTTPSIHVRATLTWLAIVPLVAIGLTATAPFTWAGPGAPRVCADTEVSGGRPPSCLRTFGFLPVDHGLGAREGLHPIEVISLSTSPQSSRQGGPPRSAT